LNALPDELAKFIPRITEVILRWYRFSEVDYDLAQTTDGVKTASLGGDLLHVRDKHRHNRDFSFLRDVVNPRLARRDGAAISTRSLRIHNQVEMRRRSTESFQLFDPSGIETAAVQQKADVTAENAFDPGSMPHMFVAQNLDWVIARTPGQSSQQNRIEQADVVAGE